MASSPPSSPGFESPNPFSTPSSSRPSSIRTGNGLRHSPLVSPLAALPRHSSAYFSTGRSSALPSSALKKLPRMRSHMIPDGTPFPKPWLQKPQPRQSISYYLVYLLIFLGAVAGGILSFFQYKNVQLDRQPLCLVMSEDFSNPSSVFDPDGSGKGSFFREVGMDGNGNGEFEMTTASSNNSFVQNGYLYLVPTLTSDNLVAPANIFDGTVYNISGCTFNLTTADNGFIWQWDPITQSEQHVFDTASYLHDCSAIANNSAGTIINPVQSARLSTRFNPQGSIKYGRVDVRAKMPKGDWMWPAIWMLPKDSVYGPWPRSGEIDIVESRGNGIRYTGHGANYVQGSLNWGPSPALNGVSKSYSWWTDKRVPFSNDFHTYTLEWTDKFLRISVDTKLHTLLDFSFNKPFFQRGDFPSTVFNGSSLVPLQNPWVNGTDSSPFDQEFYLILNVAVGGTNGWFPEGQGNKPWLDRAQNPMLDFAKAENSWYPTWPADAMDRGMVVDYVKMWKHCDGN